MRNCLTAIHLCAHFCAFVILGWSTLTAAAAPACRQVLIASVGMSQEQFQTKIAELAQMKLTLDLDQLGGGESEMGSQIMAAKYPELYRRFIADAQGIKSEAEIKKLIVGKVAELQGKTAKEQKTDEATREQHKIVMPKLHSKYKVKETIEIPFEASSEGHIFEFVREIQGVVMEKTSPQGRSLVIYDIEKKKTKIIEAAIVGAVLDQRTKIVWALNAQGKIVKYDLVKKTKEKIATDLVGSVESKLDISPSGDKLIVQNGKPVYIFDLKTDTSKVLTQSVNVAKFITDDVVIYIPEFSDSIVRENLIDGQKMYVDEHYDGIYDLYPSADRENIVMRAFKSVHGASAKDLQGLHKRFIRLSDDVDFYDYLLESVKAVAGGHVFFVRHATSYSQQAELYFYDPHSGFEVLAPLQLPESIINFTLSEHGDVGVSFHKTMEPTPKFFLDVWVGE